MDFITKHYYPSIWIFIPMVIIIIGFKLLLLFRDAYTDKRIQTLIFGIIFVVGGLIGTLSIVLEYGFAYKNIWMQYKKGNYLEYVGVVNNLEIVSAEANGYDEFDIDKIHFSIGNNMLPGYHKLSSHGGLINENGMTIKVRYIPYEEQNCIMEFKIIKK